jgi:hypothetical protein
MPIRLAFSVLAALLVLAPAAFAGTPGKWTIVGGQSLDNIDEATLLRTPDNVLHLAWTIPSHNRGGAGDALVHASIAPNGGVNLPNSIQENWASIGSVSDLILTGGNLRTLFGGIRTTESTETNGNLNTAVSSDAGQTWALQPGTVVKGDSAYGSDIGAATAPDGTVYISWAGTGAGAFTHAGLDPATPNYELNGQLGGGCCGYSSDIAVDQAGQRYVAWLSNGTGKEGLWVQELGADGAPSGVPVHMPGSSTLFNGSLQTSQQLMRASIVARPGGGVYAAYSSGYPTATKAIVWKIGTAKQTVVASSKGDHIVGMAAAPDGHLWLVWVDRSGGSRIFAARSDKKGGRWGPAVPLGRPAGQSTAYKVAGNAQANTLDVVALFSGTGLNAQWHTQALPGLALKASPSKVNGNKATTATFTVTDPEPVKGAKVSIGSKSATTDSNGKAELTIGPTKSKSATAFAKKDGYTSGKRKVKIRH